MDLFTLPNFLLYSLPVAAFLIYVPYMVVAISRINLARTLPDPMVVFGAPRSFNDKLPDYAQRANWAHKNAFESFILYAPAAVVAYLTDQNSTVALGAVIAYLVARTLFPVFYILNIPPLRSFMFGVGSLSIFTLFFLGCQSLWLS